ncbi:MAG: hypothetical protein Unbinned1322contig1000_7 [Prokaryotic dsDNA virus sp.]|nr:MAG: hypothetical protein Unbinned1322contig1000_7 [Prokaryotic dsDNA virus sp.]|tara:strand:+ start:2054 stop:2284 length:231 start_codon:yes stop_codon:yes gene_type:complete
MKKELMLVDCSTLRGFNVALRRTTALARHDVQGSQYIARNSFSLREAIKAENLTNENIEALVATYRAAKLIAQKEK